MAKIVVIDYFDKFKFNPDVGMLASYVLKLHSSD